MKKHFFYAATLALLVASCTNDEYTGSLNTTDLKNQEISFLGTLAEDPSTRGTLTYDDISSRHIFSWYGDRDDETVAVWGTNVTAGAEYSYAEWTDWTSHLPLEYKPATPGTDVTFTSVSSNRFYFPEGNESESAFLLAYPFGWDSESGYSIDAEDNKFTINMPSLAKQTQKTATGEDVTQRLFMFSYIDGIIEGATMPVGYKLTTPFTRATTAVVFKTDGYDYGLLGKLKTITLTSSNHNIDYGAATFSYIPGANTNDFTVTESKGKKSITLTLGADGKGLEWSDDYYAYMAINNVTRDGVEDLMTVVFTFDNITITKTATSKSNWPASKGNNNFVQFPTVEVGDQAYMVSGSGSNRTLTVYSGEFSDVFDDEAEVASVSWNGQPILATNFKTIISHVNVNNMSDLAPFTSTTSLTLKENTKISGLSALSALTTIDMPLLTTIADQTFSSDPPIALANVLLPSYKFNKSAYINDELLKKDYLTTLDMSGVAKIGSNYTTGVVVNLEGFTKLKSVTVVDNIKVGTDAFKGCTSLTEVKGIVSLVTAGQGMFDGCTKLAALTIASDTNIPAKAFNNCQKLELSVAQEDGTTKTLLAPTKVGEYAFYNNKLLTAIDLSTTTTLGASAFQGCAALVDNGDESGVLTVRANTISASAFQSCTSLGAVYFTNATVVEDLFLGGTTALTAITFGRVFTAESLAATAFGTAANIKANVALTVHKNQANVDYAAGTISVGGRTFTFSSISK